MLFAVAAGAGVAAQAIINAQLRFILGAPVWAATAHLPVIIVTGTALTAQDLAEFSCVLRKPLHTEALIHEIEKCVQRNAGSRLL